MANIEIRDTMKCFLQKLVNDGYAADRNCLICSALLRTQCNRCKFSTLGLNQMR